MSKNLDRYHFVMDPIVKNAIDTFCEDLDSPIVSLTAVEEGLITISGTEEGLQRFVEAFILKLRTKHIKMDIPGIYQNNGYSTPFRFRIILVENLDASPPKYEDKIKNQADKIKELETVLRGQRHQLKVLNDSLRKKNLMLDALHYVWCDGGCEGGVHRFEEMENIPLTEDIVRKAEYMALRLRTWFTNKQYRDKKGWRIPFYWRILLHLAHRAYFKWRKKQHGNT
jgi:hypothetical protein